MNCSPCFMKSLISSGSSTRLALVADPTWPPGSPGNIPAVSSPDGLAGCDVSVPCWEDVSFCADVARSLSCIVGRNTCWPVDRDGGAMTVGSDDVVCGPGAGSENGTHPPTAK